MGKAAAAGGVGRVLDRSRHGLVLSVGIAGALGERAQIGQAVAAGQPGMTQLDVAADHGRAGEERRDEHDAQQP